MHNQHTENALFGLYPKCSVKKLLGKWRASQKIIIDNYGCWIWQGAKGKGGYGHIGVNGKVMLVHRVVYFMCVGDIEGAEICHNCPTADNPSCCNPAHLFFGTHADNMRDASRKGRIKSRDSRGSKNPMASLTEDLVVAMREKASQQPVYRGMFARLGEEFGVTGSTATRIIHRLIWKHV